MIILMYNIALLSGFVTCIMKFRLQATTLQVPGNAANFTLYCISYHTVKSWFWLDIQVDSPGTVLIITLLDILALDILGLDILGLVFWD